MEALTTRETVGQLLSDWCWANDAKDMGLLAELLTADATFSVAIGGAVVVGPLEGRDAIIAFVGEAVGAQTITRRHCVSTVRGGETATAYLTILETEPDGSRVVSTGVYRATVADGRLDSLVIELDRPY